MTKKQIIRRSKQIDNKLNALRREIDNLLEEIYLKNDTSYSVLEESLINLRNFDLIDSILECEEDNYTIEY